MLERLSLKDTSDGVTSDGGGFFCLLQELYQQNRCQVVAKGHPRELSGIEWLIIGEYILTVYLPADLDDATVSSLERLRGLPHWPEEADLEPEESQSKHPMVGFLS